MPSVTNVITRPRTHPGRADNDGQIEFYLVEFDAQGWSYWAARNAAGVPVDGEPLEDGSALLVTYKSAVPVDESPVMALVEVRWSLPTTGTFEPKPPEGGIWSTTVESDGVSFVEPWTDDNGNPMMNSAGDPLDPALDLMKYDEAFRISYLTDFQPDAVLALRGKINSDAITMTIKGHTRNFDPKTLQMGNCGYGIVLDPSGQEAFHVKIELIYRMDTWERSVVDQGFNRLNDNGDSVKIVDANGEGVTTPKFLDGNGQVLASGQPAVLLVYGIPQSQLADFATALGSITG